MKYCRTCATDKPASLEFFYKTPKGDGLTGSCRECVKSKAKASYERNRCKRIAAANEWRLQNKERAAARVAERRATDPVYVARIRAIKLKSLRKYRQQNSEKIRAAERERRATDVNYRLAKVTSHRIRQCLVAGKEGKGWQSLVGYSVSELRSHLERQFGPGMSWTNHGSYWQIDHIVPISSFDLTVEGAISSCWALSNLRPLRSKENLSKGSKRLFLL